MKTPDDFLDEIKNRLCDRDLSGALMISLELYELICETGKPPDVFLNNPLAGTIFGLLGAALQELLPWAASQNPAFFGKSNSATNPQEGPLSKWAREKREKVVVIGDNDLTMTLHDDPWDKAGVPGETKMYPMVLRVHEGKVMAAMTAIPPDLKKLVLDTISRVIKGEGSEYEVTTLADLDEMSLGQVVEFQAMGDKPKDKEDLH